MTSGLNFSGKLGDFVRAIPDFPIKGVIFRDISPLLANPEALQLAANELVRTQDLSMIDAFVGIESRGFILAALLAGQFRKGFIPLRKAGKLPPPVHAESYSLEYGTATLEISTGEGRVMIIDDVLATGGTLQAALNLCAKAGYTVISTAVLIDLPALHTGRLQDVHAVLSY